MKHLGDITKIHGCAVPITDCVIGGSPCQDLSIAGKREGLAGARSGLFMEQIRIVKEMRERDRFSGRTGQFVRPRYMVWENVPGAFSSNKGEDFRAVLEEVIRIAEPSAPDIPLPEKGKWPLADCWYGDGWSVAYRVLDAQFWGVPQRRRRIALVADFGGHTAPEILFERKGVCGDIAESGTAGERTAGDAENGVGATEPLILESNQNHATIQTNGICTTLPASMGMGGGYVPVIERSLTARNDGSPRIDRGPEIVCFAQNQRDEIRDLHDVAGSLAAEPGMKQQTFCIQGNCIDRADTAGCNGKGWTEDVSYTLNTIDRPAVFDARGNGDGATVSTLTGDHQNRVTDYTALCIGNGQANQSVDDKAGALNCMHDQMAVMIAAVDCRNNRETGETFGTLQAKENGGQSLNYMGAVRTGCSVRRLTPLECERLQGYPDGWTDIPGASDSARYKALGNSIALPFWRWMLTRMSTYLPADATLGSLFDGIGGFPLIWEETHGKGTARWASEIEPFPIAVTKYHLRRAYE
jgi:DNA (cytosine-5)-methyltransferase 1